MGVGPIPVSKIREHAREQMGLSDDAEDRFVTLIRQMDDEDRTATAKKMKTPGKNEPDPDKQIPADDVEGVRAMFRGLQTAKKPKPGKERT